MKTPDEWFKEAMARPVKVPEKTLEKRIELAEKLRALAVTSGIQPTTEMIADEMLIITGRMNKEEFNKYLQFKAENGGWA